MHAMIRHVLVTYFFYCRLNTKVCQNIKDVHLSMIKVLKYLWGVLCTFWSIFSHLYVNLQHPSSSRGFNYVGLDVCQNIFALSVDSNTAFREGYTRYSSLA